MAASRSAVCCTSEREPCEMNYSREARGAFSLQQWAISLFSSSPSAEKTRKARTCLLRDPSGQEGRGQPSRQRRPTFGATSGSSKLPGSQRATHPWSTAVCSQGLQPSLVASAPRRPCAAHLVTARSNELPWKEENRHFSQISLQFFFVCFFLWKSVH